MTKIEKQKIIQFQLMKLQRLSNIVLAANELIYDISVNVRSISDYDSEKFEIKASNINLFDAINNYKTLLTDFGELK